ncbi:MAG: hypothetical protein L0H36_01020 [bacterium]|nr:hypothetical protein [bacterium]MDN5835199.1 hypothetical protein [bacterium]
MKAVSKQIALPTIILIAATVLFFVAWGLISSDTKDVAQKPSYNETVIMHMDHPTYTSMSELKADADYIFIGEAMDNGRVVIDAGDSGDPDPAPDTYYTLEVHDVIKGNVGKKATLVQSGGVKDGVLFTAEDYPSIDYEKIYIVFAIGSNGEYGALAGGYAISEIKDGSFTFSDNTGAIGRKPMSVKDLN